MTKIYITGDRMIDPLNAVNLVNISITKLVMSGDLQDGSEIYTGDNVTGIERAVRYMLPDHMLNVISYSETDGKPDFVDTFKVLKDMSPDIRFIFLHPDPFSSKILASILAYFPETQVEMPLQEIL